MICKPYPSISQIKTADLITFIIISEDIALGMYLNGIILCVCTMYIILKVISTYHICDYL